MADLELNKRASGPTPKELARIPRRICVASGTHRVRALRGALRTGAITDLVLDDALAKALMEKYAKNNRRVEGHLEAKGGA